MNKILKIVIPVLIVVLVIVLAFTVSAKQPVKIITYKEFNEIKERKDGYVYYGSKGDEEFLNSVAKNVDIKLSILDPADLSSSEIKEENLKGDTLYLYKDGKVVYKYSDDLGSYKFIKNLMSENLIEKSYIPVTLEEYTEIVKQKGYNFMFVGSETCGYCTQFKESIKESLKDYDYNIYYLDISGFDQEEADILYETDTYFTENEWGTPLNLLYKDGKRVDVINGYVPTDELVTFLKENKVI